MDKNVKKWATGVPNGAPSPEPQTNWKASGRFLFVWLRRRRRQRDTVQIVVFVGGSLLETIVPYVSDVSAF